MDSMQTISKLIPATWAVLLPVPCCFVQFALDDFLLEVRATPVVTPSSPVADIEVLVRYVLPPGQSVVNNGGALLVIAEAPGDASFFEPSYVRGYDFPPSCAPWFWNDGEVSVAGDLVSDIFTGQVHFPPSFAGRVDNPLSLWTVTWIPEDFTPRAVRIIAESDGCFGWTAQRDSFTQETPDPGHATIVVRTDCPADLDGDGALTVFDFIAMQNFFTDASPVADLDADGDLTLFDFLAFQNAFAMGCP